MKLGKLLVISGKQKREILEAHSKTLVTAHNSTNLKTFNFSLVKTAK